MAVKIKIGPPGEQEKKEEVVKAPPIKMKLEIRKALDGSILIFDHEDIDIVLIPHKSKVLTYAKEILDDKVYATQSRLFKYLVRKGVVDPSSVKSGNIYSSLEGKIFEAEENGPNNVDMTLLVIGNFIAEEKPHFSYLKAHEEQREEELTDPDDEETTELGEVPQARKKGSIRPDHFFPE